MPRLPTQSAVLSPEANIDFHVFGAIQAPQAQACLTVHNYHARTHTSLVRASLSRRVCGHPAASIDIRIIPSAPTEAVARDSSLQIDPTS